MSESKIIASEQSQDRVLYERFHSYIRINHETGCWDWIGATKNGYGELNYKGSVLYCHRLSWEFYHGAIPAGKLICHTCHNRACVHPDHLYLGSKRTNFLDALSVGAIKTKINPRIAEEIRKSSDPQRKTAKKYGVSQTLVGLIQRGKSWNHV